MNENITELLSILTTYSAKFNAIAENEFSAKPNPKKWSKKEIVGHLVDSGHNTLRRFIVGQYENQPPKITYEQDFWVIANGYQNLKQTEVIELWRLVNLNIVSVLKTMDPQHYHKQVDTGKASPQLHALEWLASDYIKHMKHHINQIIPGSFDVIYS